MTGTFYFLSPPSRLVPERLFNRVIVPCLCAGVLFCGTANAQFEKDYQPLKVKGPVPSGFVSDLDTKVAKRVKSTDILNAYEAQEFFELSEYLRKKIIIEGHVYYNDEVSNYLKELFNAVVPGKLDDVEILLADFQQYNAATLPNGTILINIGLLAQVESEAELAFILAHEYTHFGKNHALNARAKEGNIRSEESRSMIQNMIYRQLAYSRENEFEADAGGLDWMISSPFDAHASIASLKHLADGERSFFKDSIAFEKLFGEQFVLADSLRYKFKKSSEEEDVINTVDDDIYQSHPDTEKRYTALAEILEMAQEVRSETQSGIQNRDEARFQRMKTIAGFEMVESAYRHSDYVSAMFLSASFLKKFPDNNYLKTRFAQAFYWITYFDANKGLDRLIQNDRGFQEEEEFVRLVSFLKLKTGTELKKLCYNHFKAQKDSMQGSEAFYVYFAMSSELFLGKEAASFIYKDYLAKFPNGSSRAFIKTKVE